MIKRQSFFHFGVGTRPDWLNRSHITTVEEVARRWFHALVFKETVDLKVEFWLVTIHQSDCNLLRTNDDQATTIKRKTRSHYNPSQFTAGLD